MYQCGDGVRTCLGSRGRSGMGTDYCPSAALDYWPSLTRHGQSPVINPSVMVTARNPQSSSCLAVDRPVQSSSLFPSFIFPHCCGELELWERKHINESRRSHGGDVVTVFTGWFIISGSSPWWLVIDNKIKMLFYLANSGTRLKVVMMIMMIMDHSDR